MFQITYEKNFSKKLKKFVKKHPNLLIKFKTVVQKLENDPFESSLKTHKLSGQLHEHYACSINHEYRMILTIEIIDNEIILIDVGTHDEVYK